MSQRVRERHGRSTTNQNAMTKERMRSGVSAAPSYLPPAHHHGGSSMRKTVDDADVAAGRLVHTTTPTAPSPYSIDASSLVLNKSDHSSLGFKESPARTASGRSSIMTAPASVQSLASLNTRPEHHPSDLEFFEDLLSEPVVLLGVDISHLDRRTQFLVCACGVFAFSLLYGYLQELISVKLCNRQLGLFLAMMQFSGYTLFAYILRNFVYANKVQKLKAGGPPVSAGANFSPVPFALYLGLSLLRAIDLGMTNLAMQYINYPAKTLMKSSRVVFTMLFGVIIARKVYKSVDYLIVIGMVAGLVIFMHADANSSAIFDWAGVAMLTVSLLCDGAISNMSETIMNRYGVGQDEFIFRMYSIALVAISAAAAAKGDLREGLIFMSQPGSYGHEMTLPIEERTWSVTGKVSIMVLFSSMGFFGSSCSAAITKNFGALTMSITSTARKATTLFLSFFLFNNICTLEHLAGIFLFISALTAKSLRRGSMWKKKRRVRDRRAGEMAVSTNGHYHRHYDPGGLDDLETRALLGVDGVETTVSLEGLEEGMAGRGAQGVVSPPTSTNMPIPTLVRSGSSANDTSVRDRRRNRKKYTKASASPDGIQVL